MTTSRTARLTFTTSGGKTISLTVPQPREDIQLAEAMDVMNGLIAGGIFLTTNGTLTEVRDIRSSIQQPMTFTILPKRKRAVPV